MLCLCSKEDAYMCVTAEEEEEEELALCSLVIGDCLLAPQNRRSSFLGPGLTLRSLSTGPCCVTTYHLCSLAVPPSPNCSAILFYRPLRKKYSDVFASVMNRPPRALFTCLPGAAGFWGFGAVCLSVRTEKVCWDLYSSDAREGGSTQRHTVAALTDSPQHQRECAQNLQRWAKLRQVSPKQRR